MKKITVIQMNARHCKSENIDKAERLIREAWKADRADYILTPEHSFFLGGSVEEQHAAAESLDGDGDPAQLRPAFQRMTELAVELGTTLHIGSMLIREGERVYNASAAIGGDGRLLAVYRKIHLFDVDLPNGTRYRESEAVSAGDAVVTFDHDGVRVGCSICYDVRFPELYTELARRGAEAIMIPAAFTFETGSAHWDVLIRSRAIETQCYAAAAAQIGAHRAAGGERLSFGNAQIVDPWGRVAARCSDVEGWASAAIDLSYQRQVRRNLPTHRHRRAFR